MTSNSNPPPLSSMSPANPISITSGPVTIGGTVSISHTSQMGSGNVSISGPTTVTSRRNNNNTSVTIVNANNNMAQNVSMIHKLTCELKKN